MSHNYEFEVNSLLKKTITQNFNKIDIKSLIYKIIL